MADVFVDNQREHDAPSPVTMDERAEKKQEIALCDDSDNQQSNSSETSDDETVAEARPTSNAVDVDIDAQEDECEDAEEDEMERRLTWIGEGLLDGEGLDAVQQLMNLPSKPPTTQHSIERSGNKLLDFIAKEESFGTKQVSPSTPESEAAATVASLPALPPTTTTVLPAAATTPQPENDEKPEELASPTEEGKRQNKLLDFLASDIGERYLDDVYQDEDRDDEDHEMIPEHTVPQPVHSNNKLLAFLARERGERVHEVEKLELDDLETPQARRPEPYAVHIRFETEESAAAALDAEGNATDNERTVSPEPTPEATTITELDADGNAVSPAQPQPQSTGERNKLTEFVKNVQPTSRPKFVIFNPDDLMSSSSSSEGEEGSSPKAGHARELRLKKRSQQQQNGDGRVRFANPGLDLQTGVIRQAVMDHYGREELLDFVAHVDENSVKPPPRAEPQEEQRTLTPPPVSPPSPPPRQESPPPPVRHETPPPVAPVRRDSPPLPLAPASSSGSRKADGRLASFLRKFSGNHKSKSSSGSESGGSRASSRTNSPELLDTRNSAPPPTHPGSTPACETTTSNGRPLQFMLNQPMAMPAFLNRTSVESEPEMTTPVEAKMGSSRVSFEPSPRSAWLAGSENGDPSSKRMALLSSLRLLLEDCEKNELSDIAMVRISILLSTVNQIVKEDLRKERPAQNIMRRLSMHVPGPSANAATAQATPAPWVRSSKQQEEYERGHTTTAADIAAHVETKAPSPPARALSPQHTLSQVDEPVSDGAMTSFTEFETAQNLSETLHAYDALLRDCGLSESAARQPLRVYNQVKSALYAQCSFRQKQLFRLLDAKLGVDVYKRQPCLHKRVCVVGMGPVGLRAAVELALLGAQVVVVDKRKMFSRENILHMWPWVVQDLTSLGAKVFFPQFCHSSAYFHVGTRQLQCILLKVALLLGVKVHASTSFEGLVSPDSIVSDRKSFYTVVTKPQIPWMEFTAVLGACGTKDKLAAHANIKRFVFSRKEAIGLVCYFPNLGTNEEKKVKEFSWTIQFKQRMFAKMREIGIDLENVVYYRGEYHYIVMTPKRTNLQQQGVLKINYPTVSDLVGVDNIDPSALNDYVSRIINFFEIPQKSEFARVRLFDFSTRTRAAQAANVLSSRGKKLYVGLIGDALMEPFWPEGLGTCRGFLGAMDACWMVSQIGKQSDEQILADRELGYRIVQHISGFQRDDLQKNVRKYNVDPTSRYTVQYPATITY